MGDLSPQLCRRLRLAQWRIANHQCNAVSGDVEIQALDKFGGILHIHREEHLARWGESGHRLDPRKDIQTSNKLPIAPRNREFLDQLNVAPGNGSPCPSPKRSCDALIRDHDIRPRNHQKTKDQQEEQRHHQGSSYIAPFASRGRQDGHRPK